MPLDVKLFESSFVRREYTLYLITSSNVLSNVTPLINISTLICAITSPFYAILNLYHHDNNKVLPNLCFDCRGFYMDQ